MSRWIRNLVGRVRSGSTSTAPSGEEEPSSAPPVETQTEDDNFLEDDNPTTSKEPAHRPTTEVRFRHHQSRPSGATREAIAAIAFKIKSLWAGYNGMRTEKEKNAQLNKILPLFLQVYEGKDVRAMQDTFGDVRAFCFAIARRLVREIRRVWKVTDPAEANALAILRLMSGFASEEHYGMELLRILDTLLSGSANAGAASEAAIPSTYFKVLQLFFHLPATVEAMIASECIRANEIASTLSGDQYIPPPPKTFSPIDTMLKQLHYLLSFRFVVQELTKSDTLPLLFHLLIAEECPPHNWLLRERTAELLGVLIKYHFSDAETIQYVAKHKCIDGMLSVLVPGRSTVTGTVGGLPPEYVVTLVERLVECLKESCYVSDALISEFRQLEGYTTLLNYMLWLETHPTLALASPSPTTPAKSAASASSVHSTTSSLMDRLLNCVHDLVFVGTAPLPEMPSRSPYVARLPPSASNDEQSCVRNLDAFLVLQNYFLKSTSDACRLKTLDFIRGVYAANAKNFRLLEHLHTLAHFIELLPTLSTSLELSDHVLKTLVFVVTVVNVVPFQELSSLCCLLQELPSLGLMQRIYATIEKLVGFDAEYKSILREAGLLVVCMHLVKNYSALRGLAGSPGRGTSAPPTTPPPAEMPNETVAMYGISMDCLALIVGVRDNAKIVREAGIVKLLFNMLSDDDARPHALGVLHNLIVADAEQTAGDLAALVEVMQAGASASPQMRKDILAALRKACLQNKHAKSAFREAGGFVSTISLLVSLEGRFANVDSPEALAALSMIEALLRTVTAAIANYNQNRKFFREQIGFSTLGSGLRLTGILGTKYVDRIVQLLLDLATENTAVAESTGDSKVVVANPEVVLEVLTILSEISEKTIIMSSPSSSEAGAVASDTDAAAFVSSVRVRAIERILGLLKFGNNRHNLDALSRVGVAGAAMRLLGYGSDAQSALSTSTTDAFPQLVLQLIQLLGTHYLSASELRNFLKMLRGSSAPLPLLKALLHMITLGRTPPLVELDHDRGNGYAGVYLPTLGSDQSWPPQNGYTVMMWLCVESFGKSPLESPLELFAFTNSNNTTATPAVMAFVRGGKVFLLVGAGSTKQAVELGNVSFEERRWYHVAIVHAKHRFQAPDVKLYVDGVLRFQGKAPYVPALASSGGAVTAFHVGTPTTAGGPLRKHTGQIWKIGPLFVADEPLAPATIFTVYVLGPNYCGNFRGVLSQYVTYEAVTPENLEAASLLDPAGTVSTMSTSALALLDLSKAGSYAPREEALVVSLNSNNAVEAPLTALSSDVAQGAEDTGVAIVNAADRTGRTLARLKGGATAFSPSTVSAGIGKVGGMAAALLLVEMANTSDFLFWALHVVTSLVAYNHRNTREMERIKGYEVLAYFLKRKAHLLTLDIVDVIVELIGARGAESKALIANWLAFKYMLLDWDVWKHAALDIQRTVMHKYAVFIQGNHFREFNISRLRKFRFLGNLLHILKGDLHDALLPAGVELLRQFLENSVQESDLEMLSEFLVATMQAAIELDDFVTVAEQGGVVNTALATGANAGMGTAAALGLGASNTAGAVVISTPRLRSPFSNSHTEVPPPATSTGAHSPPSSTGVATAFGTAERREKVRNMVFEVLLALLVKHESEQQRTLFVRVFGSPQWVFHFIRPGAHPTTVAMATKFFVVLFQSNARFAAKFRAMYGFALLEDTLPSFYDISELYYVLLCLVLGRPITDLPAGLHEQPLGLLELFTTFTTGTSLPHVACIEGIHILLAMLRRAAIARDRLLAAARDASGRAAPQTTVESRVKPVIEYFMHMHNNSAEFRDAVRRLDVIERLIAIPFRYHYDSQADSESTEPPTDRWAQVDGEDQTVIGFLCRIADSSMKTTAKAMNTLHMVTEALPDHVTDVEFISWNSQMIGDLMSFYEVHFNPSEFIDNAKYATNMARFCAMAVDRVVHNFLPNGAHTVFRFLTHILKRLDDAGVLSTNSGTAASVGGVATASGMTADTPTTAGGEAVGLAGPIQTVFHSLNRLVVYLVGAGADEHPGNYLKDVGKVVSQQRIVFHPANHDRGFVHCLCHYTSRYLLDDNRDTRDMAMTVWKLLLLTKPAVMDELLVLPPKSKGAEPINLRANGFDLLFQGKDFSAFSYWYSEAAGRVSALIGEAVAAVATAWNAAEHRAKADYLRHLKTRRANHLLKNQRLEREAAAARRRVDTELAASLSDAAASESARFAKRRREAADRQSYVARLWTLTLRRPLFAERGVFGPERPNPLERWKLDSTEGPYRMRKKLERNDHFYEDYKVHVGEVGGRERGPAVDPATAFVEGAFDSLRPEHYVAVPNLVQAVPQTANQLSITSTASDRPKTEPTSQSEASNTAASESAVSTTATATTAAASTATTAISTADNSTTAHTSPPAVPRTQSAAALIMARPSTRGHRRSASLFMSSESMFEAELRSTVATAPQVSTATAAANENTTATAAAEEDDWSDGDDVTEATTTQQPSVTATAVAGQAAAPATEGTADGSSSPRVPVSTSTASVPGSGELASASSDIGTEGESGNRMARWLEPGDAIEEVYNCGRVNGMDKCDAVFLLCRHNFYIVDDYQYVNGEFVEVSNLGQSAWASAIPTPSARVNRKLFLQDSDRGNFLRKWAYEDIKEVYRRRYLLLPLALEFFSTDGRNYMVVFSKPDREAVYRSLLARTPSTAATPSLDDAMTMTSAGEGLEGEIAAGAGGGVFGTGIGGTARSLLTARLPFGVSRRDVTQRWQAGEISNFQYLMHLNTLAGRSFNDLTQYPVFPWVLADYESDTLDLSNPKVFRDLSKPMGALEPERAAKFCERYEMWEFDPSERHFHKYHYGTHYSSAPIVLYYMMRLEPFTRQYVALQSGRFDWPDRLFHSIRDAWLLASGKIPNMSDVNELTPEFYCFPEFLVNSNRFDFGRRSTGEIVDSVVLPPWAKGDPRLFILRHRQALESDYVSAHLHEWIDLIFGWKQKGPAAVEAVNVFHYYSYEDCADHIEACEDPVEKTAAIDHIHNFGQTPAQLFTRPHPKRFEKPALTQSTFVDTQTATGSGETPSTGGSAVDVDATEQLTVYTCPRELQPTVVRELGEAVGQIRSLGGKVFIAAAKRLLVPSSKKSSYSKCLGWGFPDASLRVFRLDGGVAGATATATQTPLVSLDNIHEGQITCATLTEDGKLLVTGGVDTVLSVFRLSKTSGSRKFAFLDNLCGHNGRITCVAVSRSYSLIVSASEDRSCILWDLNRLRLVRQLTRHDHQITAIAINDFTGDIATCAGPTIHIWTINGDPILTKRLSIGTSATSAGDTITAVTMSRGPEWLAELNVFITGHRDGSLRFWSYTFVEADPKSPELREMKELQEQIWSQPLRGEGGSVELPPEEKERDRERRRRLDELLRKPWVTWDLTLRAHLTAHNAPVTCLHISSDQKRLYSGDASGKVLCWSHEELKKSAKLGLPAIVGQ